MPMSNEEQARMLALAADRRNQAAFDELLRLVDGFAHKCDLDCARDLMKLFRDPVNYADEDHFNEHVISAIDTAGPEVWCQALLEELPRLLVDAPAIAYDFLNRGCAQHLEQLVNLSHGLAAPLRLTIRNMIYSRPEAVAFLQGHECRQEFLTALRT